MLKRYLPLLVAVFILGLVACAPNPGSQANVDRLADLEVNDPDFAFATQRSISLEVRVDSTAAPQLVEIADAEGRRLMQGAFLSDTRLDLKVPVGQASTLEVRTGQGAEVSKQSIQIDARGRAVAEIR